MTDSDKALRAALCLAQATAEKGRAPDFDDAWAAALARAGAVRKRRGMLAGSVAAAAVAAVAFGLLAPPTHEWRYIDKADLLWTTNWSAPSDSLMPAHQFDIYQDVPVLIESTETYGGALL